MKYGTKHTWLVATRPCWWWLNPWLHIKRRDRAIGIILDGVLEPSHVICRLADRGKNPEAIADVLEDEARRVYTERYQRKVA